MQILNAEEMRRVITRLAMQAAEAEKGTDFVLIGIRTRGVILARRMLAELARLEGVERPRRDPRHLSLPRRPSRRLRCRVQGERGGFRHRRQERRPVRRRHLYGQTVRAALAAISSMGRAKSVRLFTLIDRGHRELPFRADGVGKNVPTARTERHRRAFHGNRRRRQRRTV